MKVVYCAHQFSPKENIGDVLSAKALIDLYGDKRTGLCCLPDAVGVSANEEVVYGGGGMIRPYFAEREIFQDFRARKADKDYIICGVGLNRDEMVRDFSFDDLCAINDWIQRAQAVIVRDYHTKKFLEDHLGINGVKVAPCPTYTIIQGSPSFSVSKKFVLGIVPSFGHTASYYQFLPQIKSLVINLVEKIGHERVVLICHDKQDFKYAHKLFAGTDIAIELPITFVQAKTYYSQCDSIISVRGHGLIFAAACDKPCSIVALNLKMDTLFRFHYKSLSLGLDFNAQNHLLFLKENIFPKQIETPSKGELFA